MDFSDIPLFALADRKLTWLDQRQEVLSQNIANVDTPRFKPRDVAPFEASLQAASFTIAPALTNTGHLPGTVDPGEDAAATLDTEQAPDGNAVSLDDQLRRIADVDTQHELAIDLYNKYMGLFRLAIGR